MIVATRVDERLIHGQVAVSWLSALGADCILVANDEVAADDAQRAILKLAKPSGCKLVIKGLDDSIAAIKSGITDKYRLFIVVKTVKDACLLALRGAQILRQLIWETLYRERRPDKLVAAFTFPRTKKRTFSHLLRRESKSKYGVCQEIRRCDWWRLCRTLARTSIYAEERRRNGHFVDLSYFMP